MLVGEGVENLKLYFMIGLPEERDSDVMEIARLTGTILAQMREQKKRVGHVTVSLNPFVPKPWTPFQWDPMEATGSLKRKVATLRAELGRLVAQASSSTPSHRATAYFQTLVSRGDRRVGKILERLDHTASHDSGAIWHELGKIRRDSLSDSLLPNPDLFVTRRYEYDELLPWDFIDHHVHKWFLQSERKKAHHEHQSKPCDVTRCTVCGAC